MLRVLKKEADAGRAGKTSLHAEGTVTILAAFPMAALACTPTAEMRSELETAGEAAPDNEQMNSLAQLFIERLEALRIKLGEKTQDAMSWHQIFSKVDEDGSGMITYDELEQAVRGKLKLEPDELSTKALKALWCTLDVDDDNSVTADEFKRFITRGELKGKGGIKFGGRGGQATDGFAITSAEAVASKPTKEMRAELEAAGTALPADDQLTALSMLFNERLEASRVRSQDSAGKAQGEASWFNLFCEVDEDRSGFITYDELVETSRALLIASDCLSDCFYLFLFASLIWRRASRRGSSLRGTSYRKGPLYSSALTLSPLTPRLQLRLHSPH